jgi:hypothetical protein
MRPYLIIFQLTGYIEQAVGVKGMFISFGFVCILYSVVAVRWVPETHGKSYRDSVLLKRYNQEWIKDVNQITA